ncbi:MAG: hypothetical protein FJZ05_00290 [Candidatus Nealsonbacteria bacterium]|nr:hypothetical protein [Candidatus Nealsonbacteria bacterium]
MLEEKQNLETSKKKGENKLLKIPGMGLFIICIILNIIAIALLELNIFGDTLFYSLVFYWNFIILPLTFLSLIIVFVSLVLKIIKKPNEELLQKKEAKRNIIKKIIFAIILIAFILFFIFCLYVIFGAIADMKFEVNW